MSEEETNPVPDTKAAKQECGCGEPWQNDPDLKGAPCEGWVCGRCWLGIDQHGVESEVFAASRKHREEHGSTYSCAHGTTSPPDPKTDPTGYIRYILQDTRDLVSEAVPAPVAIRSRMDCIEGALDTLDNKREKAEDEAEQLRVQLAGCLVAVEGGDVSDVSRGDYGWSLPLQQTAELHLKLIETKREAAQALREHRAELKEAMGTPPPSLEPVPPGTDLVSTPL